MEFQMTWCVETKFGKQQRAIMGNNEGCKEGGGTGNEEAETRQEEHFRGKINRMSQSHHSSKAI